MSIDQNEKGMKLTVKCSRCGHKIILTREKLEGEMYCCKKCIVEIDKELQRR